MHRLPLVSLFALLAACAPSRDEFMDEYVESLCEVVMECEEDDAYLPFDDTEECEAFFNAFIDESDYDDCDYDKDAAKDCLDAVEEVDCEPTDAQYEDMEICDEVWDCPDGGDDTGGIHW